MKWIFHSAGFSSNSIPIYSDNLVYLIESSVCIMWHDLVSKHHLCTHLVFFVVLTGEG